MCCPAAIRLCCPVHPSGSERVVAAPGKPYGGAFVLPRGELDGGADEREGADVMGDVDVLGKSTDDAPRRRQRHAPLEGGMASERRFDENPFVDPDILFKQVGATASAVRREIQRVASVVGVSDRNGISAVGHQRTYRFRHPGRHDCARRRQFGLVFGGESGGNRHGSIPDLSRAEPRRGANGLSGPSIRRHELPARRMKQVCLPPAETRSAVGTRLEIDGQNRMLPGEARNVGGGGAAGNDDLPQNAESVTIAFSILGAQELKRS